MAKSARASTKKANRTNLRSRVYGPVEKARAERLHAKLLETVQQPKPERTEMDTTDDVISAETSTKEDLPKDMDVDGAAPTSQKKKKKNLKEVRKERKELRRKPKNKIAFPTSRGKGALKPFGSGRVGKRR